MVNIASANKEAVALFMSGNHAHARGPVVSDTERVQRAGNPINGVSALSFVWTRPIRIGQRYVKKICPSMNQSMTFTESVNYRRGSL